MVAIGRKMCEVTCTHVHLFKVAGIKMLEELSDSVSSSLVYIPCVHSETADLKQRLESDF